MKHIKVKFLTDHQSPHSGNEFYKAGSIAAFRVSQANVLVDGGAADYLTKKIDEIKEVAPPITPKANLTNISGIGDELAIALVDNGYKSIADLANAKESDLIPISGIGAKKAKQIIQAARADLSVIGVVKT